MSLLRSLFESRSISFQDVWGAGGPWVSGGPTHAGVPVGQDQALRLVAVNACVSLISESGAGLPLGAFVHDAEVRRPVPNQPGWLDAPNDEDTRFEFIDAVFTSLLMDGNAYVEVQVDGMGEPQVVAALDPRSVVPFRGPDRVKVFEVTLESGVRVVAPAWSRRSTGGVLHIKGHRQPGALKGASPIERARQAIGLGLVTEEFGARFFGQGSHAGGVIEVDGPLNPDVVDRLKAGWEQHHSGPGKAHRPGVLTDGAKWKQMTIAPEHAQFLETRKFQVSEIARLFRVPPHMIGDVEKSTSWGTGIEQQGIGFVTYTLRSHLERVEQRLSQLLPPGEFVKFNVNGLLRGDAKTRFEAYAVGRQWGWLNVDDIRRMEDQPPLPNGAGAQYLVPLNMEPAATRATDPPRLFDPDADLALVAGDT